MSRGCQLPRKVVCLAERGWQPDVLVCPSASAIKRSVTQGAIRWLNFERAEKKR